MTPKRNIWVVEHRGDGKNWTPVAEFHRLDLARDHIAAQKSPRRYRITNSAELDTETTTPGGAKP